MTDLFDGAPIKTLSLWQPWASLLAAGVKRHETRHWATAYRGPLAIHAAKTLDVAGAPEALCDRALGPDWRTALPRGAVVAIGRLARCRRVEHVRCGIESADLAAGNYGPDRWAWEIVDLRPLREPISALGRQGLWNWTPPEDAAAKVDAIIDHAEACRRLGWGSWNADRA